MKRRKFVLTTVTAATAVSVAGCADDEGPVDEDTQQTAEEENEEGEIEAEDDTQQEDQEEQESDDEETPSLEILEHELVEDDFSVEVQGVVRNNGDDEESYVAVEVTFYDDEGRRIDDSFTNTTDLEPGEEWAFEVFTTADADEIEEYDIEVTDSVL